MPKELNFTKNDEVVVGSQPVGTILLSKAGITVKVESASDDLGMVELRVLKSDNVAKVKSDIILYKWSQENAIDVSELIQRKLIDTNQINEGDSSMDLQQESVDIAQVVDETTEASLDTTEEVVEEEVAEEAKPKKAEAPKVSMTGIIMPMLEAKSYTAQQIAEAVKEAMPEKYADEKEFKKLIQQIKGPRVYNARKAGKDVGVVTES